MYGIKFLFIALALVAASSADFNPIPEESYVEYSEFLANAPEDAVAISNTILKERGLGATILESNMKVASQIKAVEFLETAYEYQSTGEKRLKMLTELYAGYDNNTHLWQASRNAKSYIFYSEYYVIMKITTDQVLMFSSNTTTTAEE